MHSTPRWVYTDMDINIYILRREEQLNNLEHEDAQLFRSQSLPRQHLTSSAVGFHIHGRVFHFLSRSPSETRCTAKKKRFTYRRSLHVTLPIRARSQCKCSTHIHTCTHTPKPPMGHREEKRKRLKEWRRQTQGTGNLQCFRKLPICQLIEKIKLNSRTLFVLGNRHLRYEHVESNKKRRTYIREQTYVYMY